MGTIIHTLGWQALAEGLAATGTYDSIAAAVEAGAVVIEGSQAVGGFSVITGGAGATVIDFASALEVAQAAELTATATDIGTASVTLAKTATGFKTVGLMSMTLPSVAAAVAPLAGVALGAGLYQENPALWTKISETLLPFCYSENMIHAFLDFVQDPLTSEYSPIVTIPTAIVDALKSLFESENVHTVETKTWTSAYGSISGSGFPLSFDGDNPGEVYERVSGDAMGFKTVNGAGYADGDIYWRSNAPYLNYKHVHRGWTVNLSSDPPWGDMPVAPYTTQEAVNIVSGQSTVYPPTAGVSAPSVPVEPTVWPITPIIVVPEPLGPNYEPIPTTPIVPELPPYNPPLLPEPVPDPTPEQPPEEWPEEDPWPTVIPSPFHDPDPSTEPDPNIPYIPWPLTPEKPDEDTPKPEWWPESPPTWPGEWPEEIPWPESPEDWPDEVPWPDTKPEWWPDDEPWPDSPEDWPEEIPWPDTKPEWWPGEWPEFPWPESPEDWPDEVPWPDTKPEWWPDDEPWPDSPEDWPEEIPWPLPPPWPFPWPDDVPYPWPWPYPDPSPDPYPDPRNIPDPNERIDPRIDPWPWPYPDPKPEPDPEPTRDPSQPDPSPRPDPDPRPVPEPPPSSGKINPSPPPIIPLPFSSTTGLISVYHPTQSELLSFCQWLWVTWQDATIDKIWNNPFDGVIGLFELYCTPTDVGRKNIRSGFLDSGVSSETISRYTSIDCGSIGVPEYYGDYLDYAPYSKCHIYLPFIGIVELNVDDIVGHGVNVTYRIDEYNGSCIAMITVAKSTSVNGTEVEYSNIMYQFSGNCAVDLPIAGGSQATIKAGMLEAGAWGLGSVISGVITGGMEGGLSRGASIGNNLAQGAASAVHSVVSAKSSVQHSGSFGSSFGALGNKKPFIIVTRPKQIQVPNYQTLYGYPAHKMVKIGDCTGYLRCREVHVISPQASDEEKAQIEQLLKMGVYVTE